MQNTIIAANSKRGGGLDNAGGIIPVRVYLSGSFNYSWYHWGRRCYDITNTGAKS